MPPLPNSTTVLVLGIISIIACWCFGLVGLAMGIIALVMAGTANKNYNDHYGQYSESSYKNMQAGKICAIIGTCLSAIVFIYYVIYALIIGTVFSFIPWKDILHQ
jgi:hypothetical protein